MPPMSAICLQSAGPGAYARWRRDALDARAADLQPRQVSRRAPRTPPMTRRRFRGLGGAGVAGAGLGGTWLGSVVGTTLGGCGDNELPPAVKITVLDEDVVRVQVAPGNAPWPIDGPELVVVTPDAAWPNPTPAIAAPDLVATSQLRIEYTGWPHRLRLTP